MLYRQNHTGHKEFNEITYKILITSKSRDKTTGVEDEKYLTLYVGEAVPVDGKIISPLGSTVYGHTLKKILVLHICPNSV